MPFDPVIDAALADLEALAQGRLGSDAFVVTSEPRTGSGGVITLPYPAYSARMDRVFDALRAAGFDPDAALDYIAWRERLDGDPHDPAAIARMTADDLRHLAVCFRRGERFCDGYWADLLDAGALLAALLRARALAAAG